MPKWMAAIEEFAGKSGGYTTCAFLLAMSSLLLRAVDRLDNPTTLGIVLGVFGANAIGGAVSAYRPK